MNDLKTKVIEGKVIKITNNLYTIQKHSDNLRIQAYLAGDLKHKKIKIIIGDNVTIIKQKNGDHYFINQRLKRINELKRPRVSNVDNVWLITSMVNPKLDFIFLTKMILWIQIKLNIKPVLIFTKIDLINLKTEKNIAKINLYQKYYSVILTHKNDQVINELKLKKNNVVIGRSGVGKSTLINRLKPELELKTSIVSTKTGLGKHQTKSNEFFIVKNQLVADTPGFNSIDIQDLTKEEILNNFLFFTIEKNNQCHFKPCYHDHEPKCYIKEKMKTNETTKFWWEIWQKIIHF